MIILANVEQGTPEWHAGRREAVTGTKLKDVMGTPYAQVKLIAQLIAEAGTEQSKIVKLSHEAERGSAEEAFAIQAFEKMTGKTVARPGICVSSEMDWLRLSPDGLTDQEGDDYLAGVEVKSPDSSTAIFNRIANLIDPTETGLSASYRPFMGIPADYKWQVVNYFLVNDKMMKLYFLIYDARFVDPAMQLSIIEVERVHPEMQAAIREARAALGEFRRKWMDWKDKILPSNF